MTRPRFTRGVTLLEVNLALGVLVFGVLSVAALFPVGMKISDDGCRANDAAFIAAMAKAQVELLCTNPNFDFPSWDLWNSAARSGEREGRIRPGDTQEAKDTNRPAGTVLKCFKLKKDESPGWSANCWANSYVLITSGAEAGKVFFIKGNTENTLTLECKDLLKNTELHGGDTFRIICNDGIKCIPEDFLASSGSKTIPTINGIPIEMVRAARGRDDIGLQQIRSSPSANSLMQKNIARYTYAILLDGPERGSPNLFRAFVLIFRNYDNTIKPYENSPPVEYYPFFYRKPSLVLKEGQL